MNFKRSSNSIIKYIFLTITILFIYMKSNIFFALNIIEIFFIICYDILEVRTGACGLK